MRPLRLSMSAFGPFSGTEIIDFTRLGEAPLFLINGPTGAGKTCILDAICFALYGKATGDEREPQHMRCDSATVTCLTEVVFEFELATKRFRIRRVPEQITPKKRGDGLTKKQPEAQLYELGAGGEETVLVERKVSDATAEIEARTGLNVDQFRQVMVLPQGQFRQLLMASSADREKIFSQLFQTHAYQKIETRLKEQAKGIQGKVENHRSKRAGVLQAVGIESDQALAETVKSLTVDAQAATRAKNTALQNQQECTKRLDTAKLLMSDFTALGTLEGEADALSARQNAVANHKIIVQMAEQALIFQPVIANKAERLAELAVAEKSYEKTQSRAMLAQQRVSESAQQQQPLPELKKRVTEQLARLNYLNGLGEPLHAFEGLAGELNKAALAEKAARDGLQRLQKKSSELQRERTALDERLPLLQQQLKSLSGVQQQHKELLSVLDGHHQWLQSLVVLQAHQADLQQYEQLGKRQKEQESKEQKKLTELRIQWHQGQAVVLARSLSKDQPCPVCGSAEHPLPANNSNSVNIPSEHDLTVAEASLQAKQNQLTSTRECYSGLKAKIEELTNISDDLAKKFNSGQSKTELETQIAHLNSELDRAKKLNEALNKGALRQAEYAQLLSDNEPRIVNAQNALTMAVSQQATIKGRQQTLEQQLPDDLRSQSALSAQIQKMSLAVRHNEQSIDQIQRVAQAALQEHQAAIESNDAALLRLQETNHKANKSKGDFDEKLLHSIFDTQAQIEQCSLSDEQLQQYQLGIESHEQKVQENTALVKQLKRKLSCVQAPDIVALESELNESLERYQQAEQQWHTINGRLTQLQSTVKTIIQIDQESDALEKEYGVIGTLSDVANGQTGDKISLQRFVLSVLLDDVLLAAGERLQVMSKGRYLLMRKHVKAKGNKASGLELEVEDSYTSKTRAVSTLSGGESFMAALAMALGLSDVVQAYAGGIKLDTLFIDEGFGSLDQESLDLAIRTLIDLQSSGRMVGVISHVSELKEQIGVRLDVLKTAAGSRTCLVVP